MIRVPHRKRLYALSLEKLLDLHRRVREDPDSLNPEYLHGDSIFLFNRKTRNKLDDIALVIQNKLNTLARARP